MRSTISARFSPDGMNASTISHAHHDGAVLHDDHAVTTVILQHGASQDDHDHDDGLVHGHEWATSAPMTR